MARPTQVAIETFMSITGAGEAVALQKLEEHGGDLNEAVNAYFNEGDGNITHAASTPVPPNDFMDIDEQVDIESPQPIHPFLSATRNLNPFSILNPNFPRDFYDGGGVAGISSNVPLVSHPREVREIPIEVKDGNNLPGSSGLGPTIEDVTGNVPAYAPEVHGTVIIDDEEDGDLPNAPADHGVNASDVSYGRRITPSVTPLVDVSDYNDIEEEMIQAAIEASKREVEGYPSQQFVVPEHSYSPRLDQKSPALEDVELARAVSISLKTAEQERALRGQGVHSGEQSSNTSVIAVEQDGGFIAADGRQEAVSSKAEASSQLKLEEKPDIQEKSEDVEEQLVRQHSRSLSSGNAESGQVVGSPPTSPPLHDIGSRPHSNGDPFQSDEWGGMSSQEHDEAVMLEAALFGGIPEGTAYGFRYPRHQVLQTGANGNSSLFPRIRRPPSPTLTAQRLLREQQDDEYLAALQADREKELKAIQDAEAALQKEKHQEEEIRRKLLEEKELASNLAVKEASLPQEPSLDDEHAVTLLVRMPDGSRLGRRFLKSSKLQLVFDFIDVGRTVKPGTYRLVRPYPRRTFAYEESESSLSELGLSGKQEALFLEMI